VLASGAASSGYAPSDGRTIVPMVRLGAYLEGAMPNPTGALDPEWQGKLEATIKAFADQGVYVLLDIHQDAMASTNGGAGLPWWMTAYMQSTAGQVPGCWLSCCKKDSYITTPEHPLRTVIPDALLKPLEQLGITIPTVQIVNSTNPWLAYSVGGDAGNPRSMNVGNINMRANNNDAAWQMSTLLMTPQVQNVAWRFYRAHKYRRDKAAIFDHYMTFVRYLLTLWERYSNVVALELLNEPPFAGLPHISRAKTSRTDLFDFYAAVLGELDADPTPTRAPIVIEDIGGTSLSPALAAIAQIVGIDDISNTALAKLKEWSAKDQLIYEFHWYPDSLTQGSLQQYLDGAQFLSRLLGDAPIYLGEFWTFTAEESARWLAVASELGLSAVSYWEFVDTNYTNTTGWYIYPEGIPDGLTNFTSASEVDWEAWDAYEKTVADGKYWGAYICGAGGGHMDVLSALQPISGVLRTAVERNAYQSPPLFAGGGHGGSRGASER